MKDEFDVIVGPGGTIEGIYQDGLAEALGAEVKEVKRASLVEWEGNGWTVRAAHDPKLALREDPIYLGWPKASRDEKLAIRCFKTRESALVAEQGFFWELLERT